MRGSVIITISVLVSSFLVMRLIRFRKLRSVRKEFGIPTIVLFSMSRTCAHRSGLLGEEMEERIENRELEQEREGQQQRADDYASSIAPAFPDFLQNLEKKNELDIARINEVLESSKDVTMDDAMKQTGLSEIRITQLLTQEMNYEIVNGLIVPAIAEEKIEAQEKICEECGAILSIEDEHCPSCGKSYD